MRGQFLAGPTKLLEWRKNEPAFHLSDAAKGFVDAVVKEVERPIARASIGAVREAGEIERTGILAASRSDARSPRQGRRAAEGFTNINPQGVEAFFRSRQACLQLLGLPIAGGACATSGIASPRPGRNYAAFSPSQPPKLNCRLS